MNINQKIAELGAGGLPRYNRKVNELIEAVNWLLGMRTANGSISDGGRGPVIDTGAPTAATAAQPWLTDPNGNAAGWLKVLVLNPNQGVPATLTCWEQWIWTSNSLATTGLPWLVDPNGAVAHWLMGANGGVWGTGMYPTGVVGNYVPGYAVYSGAMAPGGNGPAYTSPFNFTINPSGGNIANLPQNPPAFYIKASGNANGPVISVGGGATNQLPADTVNWTLDIIYDGTKVLSYSGSVTVTTQPGWVDVTLNSAGWVFDPSGLPGYAHGTGLWIWKYPGSISANHNPTIQQNFVFSSNSGRGFVTAFAGSGTDIGFTYLTS